MGILKGMVLHMLLEEYIKETQDIIARILSMYDELLKKSDEISLDYVADEDSVEADIDVSDADTGLLSVAVDDSRERLKEVSIGLKQALERFEELSNVSERRAKRISQLDGKLYEQTTGEKVNVDGDQELRELYAPLLEGLSESEVQQRLAQLKKVRGK